MVDDTAIAEPREPIEPNPGSKVVIVGCGETAALAYEYFTVDSPHEVVAFCVERPFLIRNEFCGLPVVPLDEVTMRFPPGEYAAFVAVSSTKLNRVRTRLFRDIKLLGYTCVSYLSSRAFVWRNATVGENCFILEHNVIQAFVRIGQNVFLWSGNHIGHNSIIHDNCFISSHVVVAGFCEIGNSCFLGVNSTVSNGVRIAPDCFVGAGAVIQKNTNAGRVYQPDATQEARVGAKRLFKLGDEKSDAID